MGLDCGSVIGLGIVFSVVPDGTTLNVIGVAEEVFNSRISLLATQHFALDCGSGT